MGQNARIHAEPSSLVFGWNEILEIRKAADKVPQNPDCFVAWFEALRDSRPGHIDALFDWLANFANIDEMRWFLWQETAADINLSDWVVQRNNPYQMLGVWGAMKLTTPDRLLRLLEGVRRLGLTSDDFRYDGLDALLDLKQAKDQNRRLFEPLLLARPDVAPSIAQGALMWLSATSKLCEDYRNGLWAERRIKFLFPATEATRKISLPFLVPDSLL